MRMFATVAWSRARLAAAISLLGPAYIAATPRLAAQDGANVPIVENSRPVWTAGREWTVSAKPILDIGIAGGDFQYQFGNVAAPAPVRRARGRGRDGKPDPVLRRPRHPLRTVGRKGMAPGEFSQIVSLTVLAADTLARREPRPRTSPVHRSWATNVGTTKLGLRRTAHRFPG